MRGFQYLQPYFINLNKSSDATVALDTETSARVGTLVEYRLVNSTDDTITTDSSDNPLPQVVLAQQN